MRGSAVTEPAGPMRLIWQGTRTALGVGLIALLGLRTLSDRDTATPLVVTSDTPTTELVSAFAQAADRGVVYADTVPPTADAAVLMAGVAARDVEAVLTIPGTVPAVSVTAPTTPFAMRRSALTVTLRGEPESDVLVTVDGASGASDTVSVRIGATGTATAAIAIEPASAGPGTWTVRAAGKTATSHAWVRPEAAVRVLLLADAPGWESRYLARALEESGARVSVHQSLGREQSVATSGAAPPERMEDLADWDVIALAGSVDGTTAELELLRRWVAERGGGLLLIGPMSPVRALAQWAPVAPATPHPAGDIRWSGPVEIVPLPMAEVAPRVGVVPWTDVAPATDVLPDTNIVPSPTVAPSTGVVVARSAGLTAAAADWVGRGRIFSSGIETWPWAMERAHGRSSAVLGVRCRMAGRWPHSRPVTHGRHRTTGCGLVWPTHR